MGPEKRLNNYLREVKSKPFRWGEHDCFIFSNTAFQHYHGFGYADDWLGRYMNGNDPMLPSKLRQEFKADTFDDAINNILTPINYVPPKGSLVATKRAERWLIGYALGISVGMKAAFLSRSGLVYLPLDEVDKAWVPK